MLIGLSIFWMDVSYIKSDRFYRDQEEGFTHIYYWLPWVQRSVVAWVITLVLWLISVFV